MIVPHKLNNFQNNLYTIKSTFKVIYPCTSVTTYDAGHSYSVFIDYSAVTYDWYHAKKRAVLSFEHIYYHIIMITSYDTTYNIIYKLENNFFRIILVLTTKFL